MKKYLFHILILCIGFTSCFFNDVENSGSETPLTTDYLLSYNFDEISGTTAFDGSGNGNNGTLSSVTRTDGKVNRAVSFPSDNSYIITNYWGLANYLGSLTLYLWIQLTELNAAKEYIIFHSYYNLGLSIKIINNHFTIIHSNNIYLQSLTTLQTGQWMHFVLTSDGNNIILYFDGQADCSTNVTFPIQNSESTYAIGGSDAGNSCFGVLDEFNIMKIALTADEVQDLYSQY